MGQTGFFHHMASFSLFVAFVMILITSISAPTVRGIGFLRVDRFDRDDGEGGTTSSVLFGTFGFCVKTAESIMCTPRQLGYSPLDYLAKFDGVTYAIAKVRLASMTTRATFLHPLACAVLGVAFLLGVGAGVCGSLLASLTALLGFFIVLSAGICNLVGFDVVRQAVNAERTSSRAKFSVAAYTLVVSAVFSLLGTILMFLTCCSTRFYRKRPVVSHPMPCAHPAYPQY